MALPLSGTLTAQMIFEELGISPTGTVSFIDLCEGVYEPINQNSQYKPSSDYPYSGMSWYGYDHNALPATLYFRTNLSSGPNLNGNFEYGSQYDILVVSNNTLLNNKLNIQNDGISQIFISDSYYGDSGLSDSVPDGFLTHLQSIDTEWNSGSYSNGQTISTFGFQNVDSRFQVVLKYTTSTWGTSNQYFTYSNGGIAIYLNANTDSSNSLPYYIIQQNGDLSDDEYISIVDNG